MQRTINLPPIYITTGHNAVPIITPYPPQDGAFTVITSPLGTANYISMTPNKNIFLPGHAGCRNKPFNEIVFTQLAKEIHNKCAVVCQPFSYGKHLDSILGFLKICSNATENRCYKKVLLSIAEGINEKPCTKLQYEVDTAEIRAVEGENGKLLDISHSNLRCEGKGNEFMWTS